MNTPILDFINNYRLSGTSRLHMPGHKGKEEGLLGFESFDITEIAGADELYAADGIIAQSEANATHLFGSAHTFYSTEGSSQCIRAMLRLAMIWSQREHAACGRPIVLAARNVHKAFVYAAALLDFDVHWLSPDHTDSLCACPIRAEQVDAALASLVSANQNVVGVYLTSPDYLGNLADIASIADACHRHDRLLMVDNAHGAYLHFLDPSLHPLDLGCDICCDSAHKTLPVLTGGAYLHVSKRLACSLLLSDGRNALALFGSTSPSYLIIASLDRCNAYLADGYQTRLADVCQEIAWCRTQLTANGWEIEATDPLRLTLRVPAHESGSSEWLKDRIRRNNIEFEYADDDYIVCMLTPENRDSDLQKLIDALGTNSLPYSKKEALPLYPTSSAMTIREAVFADHRRIPISEAVGSICASVAVSCPPAIPIVISGEVITEEAVSIFKRYHIEMVDVVLPH